MHAVGKSFVPFCSDGESTDINCLMFLSTLQNWQKLDETPSLYNIIGGILGSF